MIIFSVLRPEQIRNDVTAQGVRNLKEFLDYAENRKTLRMNKKVITQAENAEYVVAEIAEARTRAYKKEFPYVLSHDLKLRGLSHFQILLPEEVLFLFERYFDKFCANLLSAQPSSE